MVIRSSLPFFTSSTTSTSAPESATSVTLPTSTPGDADDRAALQPLDVGNRVLSS